MQSFSVVIHGDRVQDVPPSLITGLVVLPLREFQLPTPQEDFDDRIIPTIPLATHTTLETMILTKTTKGVARNYWVQSIS